MTPWHLQCGRAAAAAIVQHRARSRQDAGAPSRIRPGRHARAFRLPAIADWRAGPPEVPGGHRRAAFWRQDWLCPSVRRNCDDPRLSRAISRLARPPSSRRASRLGPFASAAAPLKGRGASRRNIASSRSSRRRCGTSADPARRARSGTLRCNPSRHASVGIGRRSPTSRRRQTPSRG